MGQSKHFMSRYSGNNKKKAFHIILMILKIFLKLQMALTQIGITLYGGNAGKVTTLLIHNNYN